MEYKKLFRWTPMVHRWLRRTLLASACVAVLISIGLRFDLSKQDWASWVQAIGSVAAILAAFWLGERQHRREMRRQRDAAAQATVDTFLAAKELVVATEGRLRHAWKQTASIATARAYFADWREPVLYTAVDTAKAMSAFPVTAIRPGKLLIGFLAAGRAAEEFSRLLPEFRAVATKAIPPISDAEEQKFWEKQRGVVGYQLKQIELIRELFDAEMDAEILPLRRAIKLAQ